MTATAPAETNLLVGTSSPTPSPTPREREATLRSLQRRAIVLGARASVVRAMATDLLVAIDAEAEARRSSPSL